MASGSLGSCVGEYYRNFELSRQHEFSKNVLAESLLLTSSAEFKVVETNFKSTFVVYFVRFS